MKKHFGLTLYILNKQNLIINFLIFSIIILILKQENH